MGTSGYRYSAWIGDVAVANGASYDLLLESIIEFTIRAALARSIDESGWEHDELRRYGLDALQLFRSGKAVWANRETFEGQLAEAAAFGDATRFNETNDLDLELYQSLEQDLQTRWKLLGYDVSSLKSDMKKLFNELEADARDRVSKARDGFVSDVLKPLLENGSSK